MYQLLVSIVAFLIAISLLVAIHEFGHFWVARRFGIKVIRFSIGFGRPLFRWYDKLGTEYVLAAIPLGGYVALFGERGEEVPSTERHMAFSYKSVFVRMAVLIAGPLFNFLFAILIYWGIFLVGVSVFIPVLGAVPKDSVAGLAGLRLGQEIVAIEGKSTPSWQEVSMQLLSLIGEDKLITVSVKEKNTGIEQTKTLDLTNWTDGAKGGDILEGLGLSPIDPAPAVISTVLVDSPAFNAGIKAGDHILKVNQEPISSRSEFIHVIQALSNKKTSLEILRNDKKLKIDLVPVAKPSSVEGKMVGMIGVELPGLKEIPKALTRIERFGIGGAFVQAVERTVQYSVLTLEVLKKMILGKVSARHISGPITIAKYAGETAIFGFKHFLNFLAVISISLGVINILPIPILDGGHFMYCVYELFTGRRVSDFAQYIGVWVGGLILFGFMLLAFYNDLTALFF